MATARFPEKFDSEAESQLNNFQGYFDPLALGMWYFGQDPKNWYGFRKRYFIDSTYYLNPSVPKLTFENDKLLDSSGFNIFSLHVHSKFLPLFGPQWQRALAIELLEVSKDSNASSFSIKAFLGAVNDRKLRQNIWLLIAWAPGINYLRRFSLIETLKETLKKFLRIKM